MTSSPVRTTPAQSPAQPWADRSRAGTLTVPAAVVAKIAAQAASELPEVGAASGGILGIGSRRNFDGRPRAEAQLFGSTAVLELDLGLTYPTPLRETTERIRAHVIERVGRLTGFVVEQVDVQISWLHPATTTRGALL